jgi:hypothetical protein
MALGVFGGRGFCVLIVHPRDLQPFNWSVVLPAIRLLYSTYSMLPALDFMIVAGLQVR